MVTRQTNLTVSSVLGLDVLWGAELLAGRQGLGERVTGVNIIEVPDVARWLSGHEFLLTTAYLWRDQPDEMLDMVVHLHEIGVAALGFKPSAQMPRLPDQVVEVADERGFPIARLPAGLAYRDIFEGVYMLLFGNHRTSHRPDMATVLGLDPTELSMANAVGRIGVEFAVELEVIDQLEGVRHVAAPDGRVTSAPLPDGHLSPTGDGSGDGGAHVTWTVPLVVDGHVAGRVTLLERTTPDVDLNAVMELADYLSLLQIRRSAYRHGMHQALDLTFQSLLTGGLSDHERADRAQLLGLKDGVPWRVAVVSLSTPDPTVDGLGKVRAQVGHRLPPDAAVVLADTEGGTLTLLLRGSDPSVHAALDCIRQTAGRILGASTTMHAGVSVETREIDAMEPALRQARVALDVAKGRPDRDVVGFEELGAEAVLVEVPSGGTSEAFIQRRLGNVDDPELVRTLEIYVASQGNKTATANAIPMHRSGLLYRLNKLSTLLDADLNDPEVIHELWLALRLQRVRSFSGRT